MNMNNGSKLPGTIYLNYGRYWWRVRLPGSFKFKQIPLKSRGSKFATRNLKMAETFAAEIWQEHVQKQSAQKWDGRLATLVQLYHKHNEKYYLPPSNQTSHIARAIFALIDYFPTMIVEDFTPLHLKEFQCYVTESGKYRWCRRIINRHIEFIKRMFKWAVSECLIPIQTYTTLTTVEGLRKGRTEAREGRTVKPVKLNIIESTMPFVTPMINDMVQIQLLSGMRPGELVRMRPGDIEKYEAFWIYTPATHKTAWHNHTRVIILGTKAQAILAKYLLRPAQEYCFKPELSDIQAQQRRHEARKTPLSCGNRPGSHRKDTKPYNDYLNTSSYRRHIARACKKAGVEPWFPHQLRHTAATEIRKEFGLDAARAVLGHRSVIVTNDYAELDLQKAVTVAKAMG